MAKGSELGEFDLEQFMNQADSSEHLPASAEWNSTVQIIFAIDASNSMQGFKIGAVNDSVNNVLSKLKSVNKSTAGNRIEVAVIGFASRLFRWTKGFVPVNEFKFSYVEMVDGLTDMKAMLNELIELTNHSIDDTAKKYVILYSDGLSTVDYCEDLRKWAETEQYKSIKKILVAFEDDLEDQQSFEFFKSFIDNGEIIPITDMGKLLTAILD